MSNLLSMLSLWGLMGGGMAVLNEYLYRVLPGEWWHYIYMWVPIQLAISYCIYRIVTTPNTNLIDAIIVFTVSTLACRIFVTVYVLHDKVGPGTWVALALLVTARLVQVAWK